MGNGVNGEVNGVREEHPGVNRVTEDGGGTGITGPTGKTGQENQSDIRRVPNHRQPPHPPPPTTGGIL